MSATSANPPTRDNSSRKLGPAKSLVVFVCLVLLGQAASLLRPNAGVPAVIRPSAGVSIAVLVIYGLRHWPLVLVSSLASAAISFVTHDSRHDMLWGEMAICIVCMGQFLLAAWMLRRTAGSRLGFRKPAQVLLFVGIVALSSLFGALVTVSAMWLAGVQHNAIRTVLDWWLGHLVGAGAFGPLVFLWIGEGIPRWTRKQWLHGLGYMAVLTTALIWASSGDDIGDPRIAFRLDLLVLPMIIVSTLGFGPASGAVAIAITLLIEAAMLVDGRGWIALTAGPDAPAAYQVLMLVLELAGLYAGALSARFQDVNAALAESQERYRILVDDSPTGIVVTQDGHFCYANRTAATIMAAPDPDALIGYPMVPELDGLPDRSLLGDPMDDVIPGTPFELHVRRLDGQEIQMELVASPVTYDGLPALQIVFTDITERRMAEEALRLSEERFSTIFEASPYMVVLTATHDLTILDINERGCRMVGRECQELIGRSHTEIGIWADPDVPIALLQELHAGDHYVDKPVTLLHSDGSEVQVLLSSKIIKINDESVSLAVGVDITDQMAAQEALTVSEERHRLLSSLIADIAYEAHFTDQLALAVDWATGAIEAITGYPVDRFQRIELDKRSFHPDDIEIARAHLSRVLSGQADEAEFRIRRADGSHGWIRNSMRPRRDAEGRVTHLLGAAKDITVQRGLEDQLLQSQKMEAVGRLAGGIAHDFNNLLTVINGYAEITAAAIPSSEPMRADVLEIRRAGERAAELTRQLLAFSRSEMRQTRPLGINQIIKGMRGMLNRVLREDIELAIDLDPELGVIVADPTQIEQVLLNLVINARDALAEKEPPGGDLTIRTQNVTFRERFRAFEQSVPPGTYVVLTVEDAGIGIAPEVREHLFEPFFTTKDVGQGTGLGLATVYGIVRQNGGFVQVHSEVGVGSSFRVGWPLSHEPNPLNVSAEEKETPRGGDASILLVEDSDGVRKMTASMLANLGYAVIHASSGAEAIELLADPGLQADLLLTDMIMPGMGGKACAEIATRMRSDLPVLFMTGYSEDISDDPDDGETSTVLPKPFDREQLARAIRNALDRPPPSADT